MSDEESRSPGAEVPDPLLAAGQLPSGERIVFRLLRPDDAVRLGEYFAGLSAQTRARYGPHAFDQATADAICGALDPTTLLRLVATVPRESGERIIAYLLLKIGVLEEDRRRYAERGMGLDPEWDCTVAPSVADDYQNRGVGSVVMAHLVRYARRRGRRRVVLWLGVQATNDRAVHFYTKCGFRKVGEFFTDKNNFDMILDLAVDEAEASALESV